MNTLKQALDMELSELKLSQKKKGCSIIKKAKGIFGEIYSKSRMCVHADYAGRNKCLCRTTFV